MPTRPTQGKLARTAWLGCATALLIGCVTSGSNPRDAGGSALTKVDCSKVVLTPGGPAFAACGHEIPSGAALRRADSGAIEAVLSDGAVIATYPPCPCDAGQGLSGHLPSTK